MAQVAGGFAGCAAGCGVAGLTGCCGGYAGRTGWPCVVCDTIFGGMTTGEFLLMMPRRFGFSVNCRRARPAPLLVCVDEARGVAGVDGAVATMPALGTIRPSADSEKSSAAPGPLTANWNSFSLNTPRWVASPSLAGAPSL